MTIAADLHSFAITERAFDDDEPVKASKLSKKRRGGKPHQVGRLRTDGFASVVRRSATASPDDARRHNQVARNLLDTNQSYLLTFS
ncbi:hypothetical protein [Methylobacterium sp. R2-1]|uniref:hypothetical protein n=1 Tax=Methylobacterium sp. R2-1 TaxID=2587064 RepID=UPI00161E35C4|nr:hypothetical protein [Methylobacterium sp. R2-1]MBB2964760.1 hypothetical protein [Methylobacterium sp. R2-1]